MDSAPTPKAISPMQLWNSSIPNPRNQARLASSGEGADSDSICKEIDAEDVGATTPCDLPAVMDSAPTPDATSLMQIWNPSIPNPRNQGRSESDEFYSICKEIDAEDM